MAPHYFLYSSNFQCPMFHQNGTGLIQLKTGSFDRISSCYHCYKFTNIRWIRVRTIETEKQQVCRQLFFSRNKLSCIRCTLPENRSNRNCPGFEPRSRNPGRLRWSSLSWTRSPGSSTSEEKARVLTTIVFCETRFGRILPFGPIFQIWRIKFEAYLLFGNFFGSLLQKILLWANFLFSNLSNFDYPFGHIWPQRVLSKLYLMDQLLSQ